MGSKAKKEEDKNIVRLIFNYLDYCRHSSANLISGNFVRTVNAFKKFQKKN